MHFKGSNVGKLPIRQSTGMVLPGERQRVRSWHGCVVGLVLRGGNTALSCKEHAGVSAEYRGRRAAAVRSSEKH